MALFLTIITASFFTIALPIVTAYRIEHPWLMYLMPLLMVPIIWDRVRPEDVLSTREEVGHLKIDGAVLPSLSWLAGAKQVFMTLLAHVFGASVGREAVGLQLGAWASRLSKTPKPKTWTLRACMAAGFAIVLGTPFAAALFIFESKRWQITWRDLVGIPLISWLSYRVSLLLGVSHSDYRSFETVFHELRSLGLQRTAIYLTLLVVISTLLSGLFLHSVARAGRRGNGILNRYVLPLLFLSVLGLVFGRLGPSAETTSLPGLGNTILAGISISEPNFYSVFNHPFLFGVLKVFLTAAFVGIGIRGGEMTPLLFAGAMIAVGLGAMLGLPIAGLVPIGFAVLWGIAARRPVTAGLIAVELFGFSPFGSLGVLTAALVFIGIKLGDMSVSWSPQATGTWRRGLYD